MDGESANDRGDQLLGSLDHGVPDADTAGVGGARDQELRLGGVVESAAGDDDDEADGALVGGRGSRRCDFYLRLRQFHRRDSEHDQRE